MDNVIKFSHPLCVISEETEVVGEKHHGEMKFRDDISIEEFQDDLANLTKTSLRIKYETEYSSHRNSKSRAKAKGYNFEFPLFKDFLTYVGPKPDHTHTLDRINNSKDYVTGNMRWADATTQNNNKSDNIHLTVDGVTKTLAQWATDTQQPQSTLRGRYAKDWPDAWIVNGKPKGAAKAPTFTKKNASEWAACRPNDLPLGMQWPTETLVNGYERVAIPRGDSEVPKFSWYNHTRLPVCVWLAAYILKQHNQLRYPPDQDGWDPYDVEPDYVDPDYEETQQTIDRLVHRFNDVMTIAWYRFDAVGEIDNALDVVRHVSRKYC